MFYYSTWNNSRKSKNVKTKNPVLFKDVHVIKHV